MNRFNGMLLRTFLNLSVTKVADSSAINVRPFKNFRADDELGRVTPATIITIYALLRFKRQI